MVLKSIKKVPVNKNKNKNKLSNTNETRYLRQLISL